MCLAAAGAAGAGVAGACGFGRFGRLLVSVGVCVVAGACGGEVCARKGHSVHEVGWSV